ncbi:hypothetical protein [Thiohalorhabdus sp.]|uniref:hypothetical protein n=1 Tax=Thiohalorhabdus sp. TaxID=3094134 RepID=UPI002FC2EF35
MTGQGAERLLWLLEVTEHEGRHLLQTTERLFVQTLDMEWYAALETDPDLAERVDAFSARFGRMQDTIGDRLVPELLRQLLEQPGSALDNLQRLEKLGLLASAEEWVEARNLRNQLVHEYMRDPAVFLQALERARQLVLLLVGTYNAILAYARDRIPAVEGSDRSPLPNA